MNRDRAIPEECRERPRIGTGNCGEVYEGREPPVTPVGHSLIDQVGNEDNLGAPEMVSGPEQDPGKDKEVIENKVGGHISCGRHQNLVF